MSDAKQEVKNQMCIEGHLNIALEIVQRSTSPDETFNLLRALVNLAIDKAFESKAKDSKTPDIDWEANVKYLLDSYPESIRSRPKGLNENLLESLCITFIGMREEIAKSKADAELYRELRNMHWTDKKLAVVKARDLKLGVQTYSGQMLDTAIVRHRCEEESYDGY